MTPGETFSYHASSPGGDEAFVVMLERASDPDRLRVTVWASGAFGEAGTEGESTPQAAAAQVDSWRRAGWTFSEPPDRILAWLRHLRS